VRIDNYVLTAKAVPLSSLTNILAQELNHTIIDKTGLTADDYDSKLKWTPAELRNNPADNRAADRPPGLFTALQEQLGLKLVASKGPSQPW
jgi:uncharacterized protein (TIGR03435 family)